MAYLPKFDDLPPVEGMPQGCAWGVFDKNGIKDLLGTLNLLTPEVVKDAAAEVRQGLSISLNWPIGSIKIPGFFRKSLCHNVMKLEDPVSGCHFGFDDEVEFNTQASSQWDSFCHFMHLSTDLTYNGAKPTIKDLQNPNPAQQLPTLDHWHQRGCVTGRGVLIDFARYAHAKQIPYEKFSNFHIGPADIEAVAAHENITFRPGDILLIRFGVTETLSGMTGEEQGAAMSSHKMCGVEGTKEMARWLWDRHFAAVASDNMAVEAMPSMIDGVEQPTYELVLHQWCLSLLGIPLGELWDLKALSEACWVSGQYSFLLTSAPLNVPGAVGSPPNALAIL
ncbi:uncharacterized protein N7446_007461 [Penicillium canescens]|uniref:uncharacterized protein n=1 Tax=Penicillium canescens TaxID=5083 RepID=UPI0026DF1E87|nr:uncharacterized protein N7446_007461 [Penicillium canescens]KAJ6063341.1 hypothetical protein N7446_007461 [Penicillium canescens]